MRMALVAMRVSHLSHILIQISIFESMPDRITMSDFGNADEAPRYERDRSASPRPQRRESPRGGGRRSASPGGNGHMDPR
jgi:hypothetical protein